jgi:putative acetyltransferase
VTITVRRAGPDDTEAIRVVVAEAFGNEGPLLCDLVDALQRHPCGRDGLSFVAEEDGAVVGHTLITRGRLDTFTRTVDVAVLSPLGVRPAAQRRGAGRALVAHAVEAADAAGFPVVFLEGDPGYYGRLGWRAAGPLGFRKPSIRIPDDAFQCVLLGAYEPDMTGTLVYSEPFWDFDAVGLRDPAFLAWLAVEVAAGRQL